jgi:hypothetical protein
VLRFLQSVEEVATQAQRGSKSHLGDTGGMDLLDQTEA